MLKYKNLIVIGTSHIAESSLNEIESVFQKVNPDLVAVELDSNRLYAMLSDKKPNYSPSMIRSLGLKGYLFAIIGSFIQQKLGDVVGIKPGSDMLSAVRLAQKGNKKLALIDQDIQITISRLSKAIGWKERVHFVVDLFSAPFAKKLKIDLRKVPEKELIKKLLKIMKKRYPGLYKVLVEERNRLMALKLRALMDNYPNIKIMAIVGAGHEDDLLALIKKSRA